MRSTRRRSGRVCGPRWSSSRPATAKRCCCGMQDCRTTRSLPRPDWRAAPWGRPWRARGADWWRRSQRESGMSISHVDDGQLHAYLDGELPQAEAWRLEAHLGECPACRGRLEEQRALIARAGELLALAAPPARDVPPFPSRPGDAQPPPPARWPARLPLAWAATVMLALAAGWYLRGEPPIAALAAPAAPVAALAVRWETIPWDTARVMLGVEPARIPNLPAVAKRRSAAERVVLVEQQLASGTVVRLHERPAAEGAPGMEVGAVAVQRLDGSERLARYVGNLRVEIEGALPADSLSKLLELVK